MAIKVIVESSVGNVFGIWLNLVKVKVIFLLFLSLTSTFVLFI